MPTSGSYKTHHLMDIGRLLNSHAISINLIFPFWEEEPQDMEIFFFQVEDNQSTHLGRGLGCSRK